MTFYQLMYLSEIARCGSISQAAKNLHISQPTLSESIRELEKEYSIRIFLRSNKGITLTQEGSDFLACTHRILTDVEEMQNRFITIQGASHLNLSTTKIPFVHKSFLDFCQEIEDRPNRISLSLSEKLSPDVLNDVLSMKADIGVLLLEESGDAVWRTYMEYYSIEFHHLVSTTPSIALRTGHPLLEKSSICEDDLNEYPMIYTYKTSVSVPNNNEGYYAYNLKRFSKIIYVYSQSTVYDMIANSNAICIISCPIGLSSFGHNLSTIPYPYANKWNAYWIKRKKHSLTKNEVHLLELINQNIENDHGGPL